MKTTDLRAKARAIFGSAVAEPMPNQPNGAKALQQRANARPIPTYKNGGAIKKPTPPAPRAGGPEADDVLITTRRGREMEAELRRREAEKEKEMAAKRARADKLLGITAKKDGGVLDRVGRAMSDLANEDSRKKYGMAANRVASSGRSSGAAASGATAAGAGGGGRSTGKSSQAPVVVRPKKDEEITVRPKKEQPIYVRPDVKTKTVKLQAHKDGGAVQDARVAARMAAGNYKKGGKADMKKGGKPKDGLAVMIAIGKPMKDMKKPVKRAVGGAGKTRKGMF